MSERPHEFFETEESRQLRERYNRKNAEAAAQAKKEPLQQEWVELPTAGGSIFIDLAELERMNEGGSNEGDANGDNRQRTHHATRQRQWQRAGGFAKAFGNLHIVRRDLVRGAFGVPPASRLPSPKWRRSRLSSSIGGLGGLNGQGPISFDDDEEESSDEEDEEGAPARPKRKAGMDAEVRARSWLSGFASLRSNATSTPPPARPLTPTNHLPLPSGRLDPPRACSLSHRTTPCGLSSVGPPQPRH